MIDELRHILLHNEIPYNRIFVIDNYTVEVNTEDVPDKLIKDVFDGTPFKFSGSKLTPFHKVITLKLID